MGIETMVAQHNCYIAKLNVTDWNSSRSVGIGGSDVGAIVGHSKYKSAYELYLDKKGNKTFEGNNLTHWGHNLEEAVAKEFSDVMKVEVKVKSDQFVHQSFPWLIGYVDRLISDGTNITGILECKTSQNFSMFGYGYIYKDGKFYDDAEFDAASSIPQTYLDQVQHYMYISGIHDCYLAVLINGAEFRIYHVPYIEELAKNNAKLCTHFWFNHVIADVPPTMNVKDYQNFTADRTETKAYQLDLNKSVSAREINQEYHRISEEMKSVKAMLEDYEKAQDECKVKLLELLPHDTQELQDWEGNSLITIKPSSKNMFNEEKFKEEKPLLWAKYVENKAYAPRITMKKIKPKKIKS